MKWLQNSNAVAKALEKYSPCDDTSERINGRLIPPDARTILYLLLFSIAFYFAYAYGMSFHHVSSAPFWPPDAVLLCALFLAPRRTWWLYILAPLPIRLLVAVPPEIPTWFLLSVYANDSIKAIISAALLKRMLHGTPRLVSMKELVPYFTIAVLGIPMLSAFAGAASRVSLGDPYWVAWQNWFLGDALANLLLTPTFIYWVMGGVSDVRSASIERRIEAVLLFATLTLVGMKTFSGEMGALGSSPVLIYFCLPLLVCAAIRFGPRGVASGLSLIAIFAIWSAEQGRGPFSAQLPEANVLLLQLFLFAVSLPLLTLAVLLEERQRVGESLRETTERLARTEAFSLVMVTNVGLDGRWLKVPPTLCELVGYSEEELLRSYFKDITHPDDFEANWRQCQLLIDGQIKSFELETRCIHKDGPVVWVDLNCSVVTDAQGRPIHFLNYIKDITGRRLAEETINRVNVELEQRSSQRTAELQAKTRELETFAYSVAHDLTAPLRGIEGYSRLLLEEHMGALNEEAHSFLHSIRDSTEHMNQLIDDLLAYAMIERRVPIAEPIELRPFIQSLVDERRTELEERKVYLTTKVGGSVVVADADSLAQAMRNYLDNAIKFTRFSLEPRIEVGADETDLCSRLWVRDNGVGFDMRFRDRIFDIFQRLQYLEDYPGTGVGLAIVRKAMERMGGRAWAESALGQGATFYLEIPRKSPP